MANIIKKGIEHTYGKLVYSHKTHEKAAEREEIIGTYINIANMALIGSTFISGILQLILSQKIYQIANLLLGFLALIISIYMYAYNHEKKSELQRTTAKQLLDLREKYMYFINDIEENKLNEEEIINKRNYLRNELIKVYKSAPSTLKKDYDKASIALKSYEENTFNEGEIEKFK